MPKRQKALNRESKSRENTGIKHRKTHLTPLQLVLMGKGYAHVTKPKK